MFDLVLHFKTEESKERFKEIYMLWDPKSPIQSDEEFENTSTDLQEIIQHSIIIKDTED